MITKFREVITAEYRAAARRWRQGMVRPVWQFRDDPTEGERAAFSKLDVMIGR